MSRRHCCTMDNRAADAQLRPEQLSPDVREILSLLPIDRIRIRAAPHGNFSITKWLLCKPLDDVMTIARLICKRFEFPAGIATAPHVNQRKCVSVRCKIRGAGVVRVRDIRREREDHRCLWQRTVGRLRQIQRRVKFDLVAHGNLDAPMKIVVRWRLRWRRRWSWRLRKNVCGEAYAERQSPDRGFHFAAI